MSWLPNWLTGLDAENLARADAADAQLREMNYDKYGDPASPDYDPAVWDQIQEDYAAQDGQTSFELATAEGQVQSEFNAGLRDAAGNLVTGTRNTIGATIWGLFRLIPLWVWLLAAVAVFLVYLGGWDLLKRKVKAL